MNSRYAENGVALAGTPLSRLCGALPRDEAETATQVYAGDVCDSLASVGVFDPPETAGKAAGDVLPITVSSLREIINRVLVGAVTVPEVSDEIEQPKEQPKHAHAGHAKKKA